MVYSGEKVFEKKKITTVDPAKEKAPGLKRSQRIRSELQLAFRESSMVSDNEVIHSSLTRKSKFIRHKVT